MCVRVRVLACAGVCYSCVWRSKAFPRSKHWAALLFTAPPTAQCAISAPSPNSKHWAAQALDHETQEGQAEGHAARVFLRAVGGMRCAKAAPIQLRGNTSGAHWRHHHKCGRGRKGVFPQWAGSAGATPQMSATQPRAGRPEHASPRHPSHSHLMGRRTWKNKMTGRDLSCSGVQSGHDSSHACRRTPSLVVRPTSCAQHCCGRGAMAAGARTRTEQAGTAATGQPNICSRARGARRGMGRNTSWAAPPARPARSGRA